jgi:hypothetical protein
MIKSFVAFTDEIDNPAVAAAEISAQIKAEGPLLENTVAFLHCHCAFLETGAFSAICEALPFPVCGFTTSINGGGPLENPAGGSGELFMSMLILTSDEIRFEVTASEPIKLGDDYKTKLEPALLSKEKPALVCVAGPTIDVIPGDKLVDTFNEILPNVPIFGGYSVDDSPLYNMNVFTLKDGEGYSDRVVFLKIFGDITPRFYSASLSKEKIKKQFAVVTKAVGEEIIALNGRPVAEFLESIGLTESLIENGIVTNYALIITDKETGTYYARAMLRLTPEKTLICGGVIPEGAHLRVGQFEKGDTISSGGLASSEAFACKAHAVLALSSISRATLLGSDIFRGIDTVRNAANGTPFIMSYVAGEICPDKGNGTKKNRFNNQSFNACVL